MRAKCGVTRDGTNADGILRAARSYGFEARAFRREPDDLDDLPAPMILFWELNHFVVLEDTDNQHFSINDPASGRRRLTAEEFGPSFTGVVLAFEPDDEFETAGRRPSVTRSLVSLLDGSHAAFGFLLLASLLLIIPGLVMPAFARVFVDNYLVQEFDSWLPPLLLGMLVTAVVRALLVGLQNGCLLRLQAKIAVATSAKFIWHVLRLPLHFFAQRNPAEVASRIMLNNQLAGAVTGPMAVSAINLLTIAVYGLAMLQYDLMLALLSITFGIVNLILFYWLTRRLADSNRRLQVDRGKAHGLAVSGLGMLEHYKASGMEHLLFDRWTSADTTVLNSEQKLGQLQRLVAAAPVLLGSLLTVLILIVGANRVIDGAMTIGTMVAFQMLASLFAAPIASLVTMGSRLQDAAGAILRLDDLKNYPLARRFEVEAGDYVQSGLPGGSIEVRDLSYGYSPAAPVLRGVSLSIEPGTLVAIVGASGSGKSTLGKIIAGLIEPWEGSVSYDGIEIDRLNPDSLAAALGYVEQSTTLFTATVKENLTLWDRTIPEADVVAAAKTSLAHAVVTKLPASYETRLSGAGRELSGGEAQRLAVARALSHNPRIVLLDEATSALDTLLEEALLANLRNRGCTCIAITHRLSAIRFCDAIFVLEDGSIAQQGRHTELMAEDGPYSRLFAADD